MEGIEQEKTPAQEKIVHKIILSDPKKLIDSLKVVNELINEATIKIEEDGMKIISMDAANVAMVVFKYSNTACTEYICPAPGEYIVQLNELKKMLSRLDKDSVVSLEFADLLTIQSIGRSKKKITLPFLAEGNGKPDKVPNLEFKATIKTSGKDLAEAIEDVKMVKEDGSAIFTADGNKFSISAESDSGRTINTDLVCKEINSEEKIVGKYAIEYLVKMVGGKSLDDEVLIRFGTEYPLMLNYKKEGVELGIILAPRVSTSD